jgi:hypothetical protein
VKCRRSREGGSPKSDANFLRSKKHGGCSVLRNLLYFRRFSHLRKERPGAIVVCLPQTKYGESSYGTKCKIDLQDSCRRTGHSNVNTDRQTGVVLFSVLADHEELLVPSTTVQGGDSESNVTIDNEQRNNTRS